MVIRELPEYERPREKMCREGSRALSNGELIALLLSSGTRNKTAVQLAEEILALDPGGIVYLTECSLEELLSIDGVGRAKACQLLAAVELGRRIATSPRSTRQRVASTKDVANIFMERMRYYKKEFFNVLLINAKGDIIGEETVTIGDISSSIVHPRESFASAIKRGAAAVIFVHNHPSGDPEPSKEDIAVTKRLCRAGEILGIRVLDHVIIGDGKYRSFKESELI